MTARLLVIEYSKDGGKTWEPTQNTEAALGVARLMLANERARTIHPLRLAEYRRTAVVAEEKR